MKIGDRVKFNENVFTSSYAEFFLPYKGHEFEVTSYMPDRGVEITSEGAKEFDNPGYVYDHVGLRCVTGDVEVQGYVHDFELVPA